MNHGSVAGAYPSVAFNINSQGSLTQQDNPASFLNGTIRSGNATGSLDATWVVFDGHRVRWNRERLGLIEAQARSGLRQATLNTVRNVSLAYLATTWQTAQAEVARQAIAVSQDVVNYQEARRELGSGRREDILQSRDALLVDSTVLLNADLGITMARQDLQLAMGEPGGAPFNVEPTFPPAPANWDSTGLQQSLLQDNPQVAIARLDEQLADIQTRLNRADRNPRIALSTGAVWSGNLTALDGDNPFTGMPFGTQTGTNRNLYAGLTFSLPLYDGGLRRRQVQNARLQREATTLSRDLLVQQLQTRLNTLLSTYATQEQQLALSREQVVNAEENLNMARERYRLGQLSLIDLRTIQLGFVQAALQEITAQYNLQVTTVEILYLSGDLVQ